MNVIAKGPKAWFIGVGIILLGIILVVIAFNLLILLLPIILIIMILSYLFRSLNKIKNKNKVNIISMKVNFDSDLSLLVDELSISSWSKNFLM